MHPAEGTSAKGDMGDRDHDRTCAREIVALHPQVGAGKRGSAVLLYIAETTFEAMHISIHSDAALECVGHAENAVPALHGEKTEWPHDIGTERRKRSVHDLTADAGQLNMAAGSKTNIGPPVSYRYRRSDPTPEIVGHLLERSVG